MTEQASFHPINKESIRRNNLIIEWQTPEYRHTPRNNDWYWITGIVAAACAVISILFSNVLLAIIILIAVFTLMMLAARPPEHMTITINAKGIRVKDRLYPYVNIKSFSTKEHWHGHVLILDVVKTFLPIMVLPIDDNEVDIHMLHQYLEAFLPEEPHDIPIVEILAERLGF